MPLHAEARKSASLMALCHPAPPSTRPLPALEFGLSHEAPTPLELLPFVHPQDASVTVSAPAPEATHWHFQQKESADMVDTSMMDVDDEVLEGLETPELDEMDWEAGTDMDVVSETEMVMVSEMEMEMDMDMDTEVDVEMVDAVSFPLPFLASLTVD